MRLLTGLVTALCVTVAGAGVMPPAAASMPAERGIDLSSRERVTAVPGGGLRVRPVLRGLDIPWDVSFLPSGAMLVTERDRERILLRKKGGGREVLAVRPAGVWHGGETGLMAILVSRNFAENRQFYTCHGFRDGNRRDIRVVLWRLNAKRTHATQVRPIVTGLPVTSGRHGGCRLRFGKRGPLYIATGDAATYTNPQSLHSLGGKVLRVDPRTGAGWPSNPWPHARDRDKRRILTYGHRNVQGLALRPGRAQMWSVEHGTYRDDEVNLLAAGGNYGWDPGPGYDESAPMTDFSLPGPQIGARWSSGNPTVATSGATWLAGSRWGNWRGRLAVAALKDSALRVMKFSRAGRLLGVRVPPALNGRYGRLRTAQLGPGGALYVTTANGGGSDKVLRVVPRG